MEELKNQLGERAAGVVDIFAAANNMTVQELFKAMEEGKVGTAQILKAAAAMDKMAEKNGALSEALKTSQAAQVRFENKMKNFALVYVRIIDPVLTAMFNALGAISDVLLTLAPAIKVVVDVFMRLVDSVKVLSEILTGMWEFVNGIELTKGALGGAALALAIFIAMCLAKIPMATNAVDKMQNAVKGLRLGMTVLGRVPAIMMFLALIELTRQLHDYYVTGGTGSSWIEVLGATFQNAFSKIGWYTSLFSYHMEMIEYRAKQTFKELTGIRWSDAFSFLGSDEVKLLMSTNPLTLPRALGEYASSKVFGQIEVNVNMKDAQGNVTTTRQEIPVEFTQGANAVGGQ